MRTPRKTPARVCQPASGARSITAILVIAYDAARGLLRNEISADPRFCVIGEAPTVLKAVMVWCENPDVVFVDTHVLDRPLSHALPRHWTARESQTPRLILVGDERYPATAAYNLGAIDYLCRPLTPSRIQCALSHVTHITSERTAKR